MTLSAMATPGRAMLALGSVSALLGLTACGAERSAENYCEVWEEFDAPTTNVDEADPSEIPEVIEEMNRTIQDAADLAPEEIQEESENVAAIYEEMMDEHDFSEDPEGTISSPEFQESMAEMEAQYEDLDGDFEAIESYLQQECGLNPSSL